MGNEKKLNRLDPRFFEALGYLTDSDFLPVLRAGDPKWLHVVILGASLEAKAVSDAVAHLCHYPNMGDRQRKTRITFMFPEKETFEQDFRNFYRNIFSLKEDILDVEWEFVPVKIREKEALRLMQQWKEDEEQCLRVVIASGSIHMDNLVLKVLRKLNLTVYAWGDGNLPGEYEILEARGSRVNYVYDKAYGNPPSANEEEAWKKASEASRNGSICCGNALVLRKKCFDFTGDLTPVYEAEHRRWMMSVLLFGYRKGVKAHICDYHDLPASEQIKDKILVDNLDYIINGL